jgi:hypothetical protein
MAYHLKKRKKKIFNEKEKEKGKQETIYLGLPGYHRKKKKRDRQLCFVGGFEYGHLWWNPHHLTKTKKSRKKESNDYHNS